VLDWRKREPTWPIRRKSACPLPLEKRLNRITLDSDFKLQRFPRPWSVEEQGAYFVVRDHSGQQLAHVYFEDEPGR
jgi:hypothetical protein